MAYIIFKAELVHSWSRLQNGLEFSFSFQMVYWRKYIYDILRNVDNQDGVGFLIESSSNKSIP